MTEFKIFKFSQGSAATWQHPAPCMDLRYSRQIFSRSLSL